MVAIVVDVRVRTLNSTYRRSAIVLRDERSHLQFAVEKIRRSQDTRVGIAHNQSQAANNLIAQQITVLLCNSGLWTLAQRVMVTKL
jgi:hypothetical protein